MLARFNLPGWIEFLIWLLIAIVIIILIAMIIHALGGASWSLQVGYFHWTIGVTGKLGPQKG